MALRTFFLAVVALALAGLAAPVVAGAATVSMTRADLSDGDSSGTVTYRVYELRYAAATAETNDVSLTASGEAIVVRDAGADLQAGPGCRQVDARTASCATERPGANVNLFIREAVLELGDGDDRFATGAVAESLVLTASGGDGADRLDTSQTTSQRAMLNGGAGDDVLVGGPDAERLAGDDGRDTITAGGGPDSVLGGAGADALDGGAGVDVVDYTGTAADLVVDLAQGSAAAGAEADTLAAFEHVVGGDGDDLLSGTSAADELVGGAGSDRLVGREGDDELSGERVDAGPGNDRVVGANVAPDCGTGLDEVYALFTRGPFFLVPRSCERVSLSEDIAVAARPRLARGSLRFRARGDLGYPETLRVTVRHARTGKVLARGRGRLPARVATTTIRARLTRAGRRALRGGRSPRLRVSWRQPGLTESATYVTRRQRA